MQLRFICHPGNGAVFQSGCAPRIWALYRQAQVLCLLCDRAERLCRLPLETSVGGAALLSNVVGLEVLHSSETAAVQ